MDTHRSRFFLEYAQQTLCPAVEAAGCRPVLLCPLPGGLFDETWAKEAEAILRLARENCPPGAELCALLPAGGFFMEPYGELPFARGVGHYASAAALAKILSDLYKQEVEEFIRIKPQDGFSMYNPPNWVSRHLFHRLNYCGVLC